MQFQMVIFLLPMTNGQNFAYPLVPMPYSQALRWLRYFSTLPWKHSTVPASANPNDYTLHSLKTTTLSWSNQLAQQGLVTDEQRHLQGHHRKGSMRLYSRDDTAGQLAPAKHTYFAGPKRSPVCDTFASRLSASNPRARGDIGEISKNLIRNTNGSFFYSMRPPRTQSLKVFLLRSWPPPRFRRTPRMMNHQIRAAAHLQQLPAQLQKS